MNFSEAVANQESRTENGMKALKSTANANVDLYFNIGASRGKNITAQFAAAMAEDRELALRILQWARDVRGGSGERQLFRDMLVYLESRDKDAALALMFKTPELGRWDDIFVFKTKEMKEAAFTMLGDALRAQNGLAAKWTPRKGPLAAEIRAFFGMSPKQYRKSLVALTNVVESAMCANTWDGINFSHVPSLAASRYKKAFNRHTTKYAEYVAALVKGDPTVKVNAAAVYPYDVLKGFGSYGWNKEFNATELGHLTAQWNSLPNYIGDSKVLPLVDVSGSMMCPAGQNGSVTCLDVAVSLGLYCADKNTGAFKDMFLTFSSEPGLLLLKGDIVKKVDQMVKSKWGMSTDLHKALDLVLKTAVAGRVSQEDMPDMLLVMSDMQFNQCTSFDDSASQMIERKYEAAGYTVPKIVFWNLYAKGNAPAKFDKRGVALVSGFSPATLMGVLGADASEFTPEAIMRKAVCIPRYDI
jgi:hypothetical protein